ncbi:hypothetical protein BD770DRAFT_356569 [Pilaira anomala]|nr:hypothetical protein BD770DRAFT_356569 [Pilaira anomala]
MGRRFDFLIRENHPKSTTSLEYGATDVAKNYDLNSNKMIIERNAKLSRVLKDMLDMLLQEKQGVSNNLLCTYVWCSTFRSIYTSYFSRSTKWIHHYS